MENYIKKVLGITDIIELKNKQFELQNKVDYFLEELNNHNICSREIATYYIRTRNYFRQLQQAEKDFSVIKVADKIKNEAAESCKYYENTLKYIQINITDEIEENQVILNKCINLRKFLNFKPT